MRLKVQSAFSFNQPVLGESAQHLASILEALGRDDIRLRVYDADKLVPPLQIFDAVTAGFLEAGYSWPVYWMGKIPALTLFGAVPFGPEAGEFLAWIQQGEGLELWRELYARHGAVPVPCGVLPPEASGWFTSPIEEASDLVGLKIRFAGLGGKVLQKLGASVTMLSGGDIFPSLERGVLDATEYSMPAVDRALGFYKVAGHYYFPGWHQPSSILELIVNKEVWDGMTPEQRAYIETACNANIVWSMTRGLALQGDAIVFLEDQGVELHSWPPALLERFRELSLEVLAEASAENADFARVLASQQAFREQHARWASIAYAR